MAEKIMRLKKMVRPGLKVSKELVKEVKEKHVEMKSDNTDMMHDHMRLENTYKMIPDEDKRFMTKNVESKIREILKERLDNIEIYDAKACSALAKELSVTIRNKIKELKLCRHKIVVQVVVAQDTQQSIQVASRCVWDQRTDNHASVTYRNNHMFATATCFGIYFE